MFYEFFFNALAPSDINCWSSAIYCLCLVCSYS